jgi:hypothetical protein
MRTDAVRALRVLAVPDVLLNVGHEEPPVDTAPWTEMYLVLLQLWHPQDGTARCYGWRVAVLNPTRSGLRMMSSKP